MKTLTVIALCIVSLYFVAACLIFIFQSRIIFLPGKLQKDFGFKRFPPNKELFLKTTDGETINALLYNQNSEYVMLYFHGNAGDLSGWQHVAEDFSSTGIGLLIVDYRGYGKSTGEISEKGFYRDADAAFQYLNDLGYTGERIIVYGRSIGSGVAVDLAARKNIRGLILEAPYTSLGSLANEKVPFFFPSLYLRFRFDNLQKINRIKCPIVFIHGSNDELIPPGHSRRLYDRYQGKKSLVLVPGGEHNGLQEHHEYQEFVSDQLANFFQLKRTTFPNSLN